MNDTIKARLPIDSLDVLISGAGMGISDVSASVHAIEVSRIIEQGFESRLQPKSSRKTHSSVLTAQVRIAIYYAAGYIIRGLYQYQSDSDHDYNFDRLEDCIAYAKEGHFNISLAKDNEYWWMQAHGNDSEENRLALIKEMVLLDGITEGKNSYSIKACPAYCIGCGGMFAYSDLLGLATVTNTMLGHVKGDAYTDPAFPSHNPFTPQIVAKIDSMVRLDIIEGLEAAL